MPHILGVSSAFPSNYYSQHELTQALLSLSKEQHGLDAARVKKLFAAVKVEGRHLALPLERYAKLNGFGERNREWLRAALELSERAVRECLELAGLPANEIQLFASSSVTGLAVPSIEARLMNRLEFAADCRRVPLFGLGCVAGAAGIARVSEYLEGHPTHAALLLCVELCSLTFQSDDMSVANLIACGLFADGAACVLLVGDEHPLVSKAKLRIAATRSVLFPNTEAVMGWDIVDTGFRIVLSGQVPELAHGALAHSIREFLSAKGLKPSQITRWIAHPGGPAVIDAMERGLELTPGALDLSRDCLARIGNLSSASVLVILQESMAADQTRGRGLLLAMGPGFCAELVLLR
ncbi:MAG TPA: 3-oxoacyl-[acyl-carrier-protein] synthase III C-terminal domain-containing protein [Polyangiaceae bacterium]|nr:3-oxoacyl-[acyl-carrier-protein] synthase III C-terminal domain-containing protein [Polyangiaceae bacterium]